MNLHLLLVLGAAWLWLLLQQTQRDTRTRLYAMSCDRTRPLKAPSRPPTLAISLKGSPLRAIFSREKYGCPEAGPEASCWREVSDGVYEAPVSRPKTRTGATFITQLGLKTEDPPIKWIMTLLLVLVLVLARGKLMKGLVYGDGVSGW